LKENNTGSRMSKRLNKDKYLAEVAGAYKADNNALVAL
jgi:hypothetical protein